MELRHGYSLADLHAITRLAVHVAGPAAGDWHERYDIAWSAVAEHLYAAETWPSRSDLVRAGQLGLYTYVDEHRQAYGYYRRKTDGAQHGIGSSPAFQSYWWDLCGAGVARSPESRIVEHTALAQIMPTLTPAQRQAILALAVHDDYQTAAAAIGAKYVTFKSTIALARKRFLAAWHEGEIPSKTWGCDRRVRNDGTRGDGGSLAETLRRRSPKTQASARPSTADANLTGAC